MSVFSWLGGGANDQVVCFGGAVAVRAGNVFSSGGLDVAGDLLAPDV